VDQSAQRIATAGAQASNSLAANASGASGAGAAPAPPTDTVDLSAEIVSLMAAKNAYAANVNVARTEDQVTQSLLNILA
jgi:flagellar hook protein FlgE